MKPFIVFAALVVASQALPEDSLLHSVIRAKWSSYKAEHGKQYSPEEEAPRMKRYLQVTQMIEEHNARYHAGLESFEMGHNEHSDWSREEVVSKRMGVRLPENYEALMANATQHVSTAGYAYPASIDWTLHNSITPVKNQGECGSCYAFSAMAALENAHYRKNKILPNLSEQHCLDCYPTNGCQGGWMHEVFKWVQKSKGVASQQRYPYEGVVRSCRMNRGTAADVSSFNYIQNEAQLMQALQIGAVSVAYDCSRDEHMYYKGGIINLRDCGTTPTHAVTCVGYGTEKGINYWILKNSWGTGWGEKGYFRLFRGTNQCAIASYGSYPTAVQVRQ